jgi:UDP-N-acetylglucosamine 2-epimerase (non-hydrolysing)
MRLDETWNPTVVSTGQHREMLDQVLLDLGMVVDHDLHLMTPNQSLTGLASTVMTSVAGILQDVLPDVVIVQGDTTTAFAVSVASFYNKSRVAHVEAGLRSGNVNDPFPEEMNRRLISQVAVWNFAPTKLAFANLKNEGVEVKTIEVTGNTVVDNFQWIIQQNLGRSVFESQKTKVLVTLHRRENQGERMVGISSALREIGLRGDVEIVLPLHLSPSVRRVLLPELQDQTGIRIVEPLSYVDFVASLKDAYLVLTDSGGVQEEAPSLGTPVLVLRETTERPEGISAGSAILVGVAAERIVRECNSLLDDAGRYSMMSNVVNPYGDGHATERILERLHHDLS